MKIKCLQSSHSRTFFVILAGSILLNSGVFAQEHSMDSMSKQSHVMLMPSDLMWNDGPPGLPAGAKAVVMAGDPSKSGLFTLRLKFPANFTIPAHWHPTDENITVVSGTLWLGMGEKTDSKNLKPITTGGYGLMPAKTGHYAMTKEETIVQLHGMGPFGITYFNPADDPRNKK